jgi:hypothetical protein
VHTLHTVHSVDAVDAVDAVEAVDAVAAVEVAPSSARANPGIRKNIARTASRTSGSFANLDNESPGTSADVREL